MSGQLTRVFAPGRVNLIGDHTDYMGGLVLPMAIDRGVTIVATGGGAKVDLGSDQEVERAVFELPVEDPAAVEPAWARHIAGVAAEMRSAVGMVGEMTSNLPVAGLSSSAAVQVAAGLALGFEGPALELAELCQRAEHRATGVPCGIMDQLSIAAGVEGHALMIDCRSLEVVPHRVPDDVQVVIVHSGQHRELVNSEYAIRRSQCEAAEAQIGALRDATPEDTEALEDPVLRARARHVVTENARVVGFVQALQAGDYVEAGNLMVESHRSLGVDFEVSTPILDRLVADLTAVDGVYGARLTGAGFGGAVVALARPGALDRGFVAVPSSGARRL